MEGNALIMSVVHQNEINNKNNQNSEAEFLYRRSCNLVKGGVRGSFETIYIFKK